MVPLKRFARDHNAVESAIVPWASTPDFVLYGETPNCPLEKGNMLQVRGLWRSLRAVHPSLCWSQSDMEKILEHVALQAGEAGWPRPLTETELGDFKKRIGLRLRLQSTHIRSATAKHPGTL